MAGLFGEPYCKIQTIFKRDERGTVLPGDWTTPEIAFLADNKWRWHEKIDGMNIRLHYNGQIVMIGGRTDNAQIPADLIAALQPYTDITTWNRMFPDADDVTLYGEGYGAGIQKGGGYRKDKSIILFDVKIGQWWLLEDSVKQVADGFGLDTVPHYFDMPILDAWTELQKGNLKSQWPDVNIEGLVGKPAGTELFSRKGDRMIVKMKVRDWEEYKQRWA